MMIWVGGPDDVRTGEAAQTALRTTNDQRFYDALYGVIRVDLNRWRQAQDYESRGWLHCWTDQSNDRSDDHARLFADYQAVPTRLGWVCEVGCGPFTQLQRIIQGRQATQVTLLDPLLRSYRRLRNCPYTSRTFNGLPTHLRPIMAEALTDITTFDTLICINVLEHVMDAPRVLENLWRALKPDGVIIFGERAFDDFNPQQSFDIGHPIHLKRPFLQGFRKRFKVRFQHGDYFIGNK